MRTPKESEGGGFGSFSRPSISSARFNLLFAVGMVLIYNGAFWSEVLRLRSGSGLRELAYLGSIALLLVLAINLFLTLLAFRAIHKAVAIFLLNCSALAAYFMSSYGVLIDRTMMQNVFESDPGEINELLGFRLFAYLLVLGVLPSLIVGFLRIRYRPPLRDLGSRVAIAGLSVLGLGLCIGPFYADHASFFPQHRYLGHLVTPLNYLYGAGRVVSDSARSGSTEIRPLGLDATPGARAATSARKSVLILVIGETARAVQFSLNGYSRRTNPELARLPVVSFDDVYACGTSTAVALPCMFSYLRRDNYDGSVAKSQEGLLDVLSRGGVRVLWRDNNSGCKGACDRVSFEDSEQFATAEDCASGECLDEALLNGLDAYLDSVETHAVIVLHQKGSHGPAYYRRTPERFKRFTPECRSNQLPECDREEIVNAYDNTILYTDHVLAEVIRLLQRHEDRLNTAMLYVSDHGESLGDHNLYLHGLPYAIAPDEQKRVPMIVWISPELGAEAGIDSACLAATRDRPLSHDHLFHSVLGLMDVQTELYDDQLDLFAPCLRTGMEAAGGGPENAPADEPQSSS